MKTEINGKIYFVNGFEKLIMFKCLYYQIIFRFNAIPIEIVLITWNFTEFV